VERVRGGGRGAERGAEGVRVERHATGGVGERERREGERAEARVLGGRGGREQGVEGDAGRQAASGREGGGPEECRVEYGGGVWRQPRRRRGHSACQREARARFFEQSAIVLSSTTAHLLIAAMNCK